MIFISYAREDLETALGLYDELKKRGFDPEIDHHTLSPGEEWEREIPRLIRASSRFVAIVSKTSRVKRGYYQTELRLALEEWKRRPSGEIFIVPVCLGPDVELPEDLEPFHRVDFSPPSPKALEKLVSSLGDEISSRPAAAIEPESRPEASPAAVVAQSSETTSVLSVDVPREVAAKVRRRVSKEFSENFPNIRAAKIEDEKERWRRLQVWREETGSERFDTLLGKAGLHEADYADQEAFFARWLAS